MSFLKHGNKHKENELDSTRVFEADAGNQIVEIGDGRDQVFEMPDTSSIREGKKDTRKREGSSDEFGIELQRRKEIKGGNDVHDLSTPGQEHSRGNSELEIDSTRESAPPSYTI